MISEKLLELLFETFNIPAVRISPPALLQIYAAGRTGGSFLSVGDGVTSILYELQGYLLTCDRVNLGGRDLTRYLATVRNSSATRIRHAHTSAHEFVHTQESCAPPYM